MDNLVIDRLKKAFYRMYPTTHISAFLRTLYLQRYIRRFQFTQVLDAGCGPGQFAFYLAGKYPLANFTGYDFSKEDIDKCVQSKGALGLKNAEFKELNLFKLNQKEKFDLIYSIDVLEHIVGNMKVIENLDRALKKGGLLYIAMPNEKDHRFLLPDKYHQQYVEWSSNEHVGDQYRVEELAVILEALGYGILVAKPTFGFWGKLAWELDMIIEEKKNLKRLLLPFLLLWCYLDTIWKNGENSYALLVIAKKAT